ncbi:MAG: helix-turn-helix transcriptional regulator [[Clostridium] innocuum]
MKYSLKELRARNNLTQAEMAERLGVSRKRYSDIEKRPNRVLCETMVNVASVLGVDIGDIFLPSSITNSNVKDGRKEMIK